MLTRILTLIPTWNFAITHRLFAPKTERPLFLSLPLEIREEIESLLDFSSRQALFKALTTVTCKGGPIDSPILKLHLIKERIQAQYQGSLVRSDEGLKRFALSQLQKLSDAGQFDEVVERIALFELICLVNDSEIFRFLQEKVRQDVPLKEKLLNWVERSKIEEVQPIAANALTVLVKAGDPFNHKDLKGIRVPGADLSYGIFDSAQLQGADLRGVKFRASWLREANLSRAQMSGVQFGEWATLQEESRVYSCAYSPDGTTCAMGLWGGEITVYDTSSWAKIHTLVGHVRYPRFEYIPPGYAGSVKSVVYSPSGEQIASGSEDKTIRLWDARSGAAVHILKGHTDYVRSVAYAPSGEQLASGSYDYTVRLWDVHSGAAVRTLKGHTGSVKSVVYAPSGEQLASGSDGYTVRLWDAHGSAAEHMLKGHTDSVNHWSSEVNEELTVNNMRIEGVQGLSEMNARLLKQRGACVS